MIQLRASIPMPCCLLLLLISYIDFLYILVSFRCCITQDHGEEVHHKTDTLLSEVEEVKRTVTELTKRDQVISISMHKRCNGYGYVTLW